MGFLNDFGRGLSKGWDKQLKDDAEVDVYKRKAVAEADIKAALDDRKEAQRQKQAQENMAAAGFAPLQPASNLDSFGLPKGTQDTPAVATPASTVSQPTQDFMGQFSDLKTKAAKAQAMGNDDLAKTFNTQADIVQQKLQEQKYKRTTAREDTTGVEGLTPAKELIKEDTAVFSKNELNTGLYEKYFGEPKALNYANPSDSDVKDINEVKKASKQASKIASILTSASADQATGKSTLSSEELKSDAVNLVKNKNILLDDSKSEQHDAALSSIHDILQNYPEASHSLFKTLELDKVPTPAASPNYGNRSDGTPKGTGFLGELKRPDGTVSTEISVGVNIDGKEMEIPTLIPTLTDAEKNSLLNGDKPTKAIVDKAVAFAKQRIAQGKPVFANNNESPTQPVTLSNDKPTGITQAEYMQLPSGATYTAPDGTTRTKP